MAKKKQSNELVADVIGITGGILTSALVFNLLIWWIEDSYLSQSQLTEEPVWFWVAVMLVAVVVPIALTALTFQILQRFKILVVQKGQLKQSVVNVVIAFLVVQVGIFLFQNILSAGDGSIVELFFFPAADELTEYLPSVGVLIGILIGYHHRHRLVSKKK